MHEFFGVGHLGAPRIPPHYAPALHLAKIVLPGYYGTALREGVTAALEKHRARMTFNLNEKKPSVRLAFFDIVGETLS